MDAGTAFVGGAADDTFKADAANRLGAFDNIDGGAGTDTIEFSDTSNAAFTLSTSATVANIENLVLAHTSDASTDVVTLDTSAYSSLRSVSVSNIGTDIGSVGTDGITVTGKGNLTSVTITGGATAQDIVEVTVTDAGTAATATAATGDTLASVSLTGLAGKATLASDALTALTINAVGGVVTNTDGYIAATDTRALTVTYAGGTNGGVTDAGATSVTIKAAAAVANLGTNTFANATSVTLDNTGGGKITTGALATSSAKTVAVIADNDIALTGTLGGSSVTALTVSGDSKLSLATNNSVTTKASATVTINDSASLTVVDGISGLGTDGSVVNNSTGTVTLGNATATAGIGAAVAYTGGAGKDVLSIGATTKAITLGAGDDTLSILSGTSALGAGGSVDAGDGTDTLVLTALDAEALSASATFAGKISGFDKVSIGKVAGNLDLSVATVDVNVTNLDALSYVVSAGTAAALSEEVAGRLNLTNFVSGGTFELTGALNGASSIAVKDAAVSTADVLNIKLNGAANIVNAAALTVANVETINVTTADSTSASDPTAAATILISAANASKITVAGNHGVDFTGSTLTAVTTLDASGVVGTGDTAAAIGTAGAVTFATVVSASNVTITTGNGADVISAASITDAAAVATISTGDGADQITGGAGADVITAGAGNDTISGGAGADKIDAGAGSDQVTGGTGADAVTAGAGRDAVIVAAGDSNATSTGFDKVADFGKVTTAVTATENAAMNSWDNFTSSTTGKGGAEVDLLDLHGTATIASAAIPTAFSSSQLTTIAGATSSDVTASMDIKFAISDKGVISLTGADAGKIDTLAEWIKVADIATGETAGTTTVFGFGGNTYVYQDTATSDVFVELTGVSLGSGNGLVVLGSSTAAAVGDFLIA